jgi:hypothetical protein
MNYHNFNRHAIFTSEDRSLVLDVINMVQNRETENMLFGLFDGYLYDELPSLLVDANWRKLLSNQKYASMVMLMHKIKNHVTYK